MVRAAVFFSYQASPVVKVQHIWNSFLWEHYAQNAKVPARALPLLCVCVRVCVCVLVVLLALYMMLSRACM